MDLSWSKMLAHSPPTKMRHVQESQSDDIRPGVMTQLIRFTLIVSLFLVYCFGVITIQLIGCPLYLINQNYYYAYMAMTKQSFGVFATCLTQWWAPIVVRISGDSSVAGQLHTTKDGKVELSFPDRLVMVANHQLYSDWLYLWWVAYANQSQSHGHVYIILKESLKHIPIVGWGMRFFSFIFLSRKLAIDEPRLSHRLGKLSKPTFGPFSGEKGLNPMWLLLFPEGTNASQDGRDKSASWAKKIGVKDLENTLLPRSSGSFFCLNELKETVDYLYDCTIVFEGVKHGEFGQDNHTLRTMFLLGQPPPSINMYWRRFALSDIPLHDKEEFDNWLRNRWYEKDALVSQFIATGRFPPMVPDEKNEKNIALKEEKSFHETEIKVATSWDFLYILIPILVFLGIIDLLKILWGTGLIFNLAQGRLL